MIKIKPYFMEIIFFFLSTLSSSEELGKMLPLVRGKLSIEIQRVHRLGKPNPLKARPIIARFLRYSNRELVVEKARKHIKKNQNLHVFFDIPKELYDCGKNKL